MDTQRTGQGIFHGVSLALLILCAAGVLLWLVLGSTTGLGMTTAFGLYVAAFFALMAAGAGLLLFSALPYTLGFAALKPLSGKANLLALACFVGGGLFILADVGSPLTLWRMLTGPNFSSPFTWDMIAFAITFVLGLAFLPVSLHAEGIGESGPKGMAWVLSLFCIALLVVEGSIVATVWSNPLFVASFLVTGVMAGAALILWLAPDTAAPEMARPLRRTLISLIALWVFFSVLDPLTSLFLTETESGQTAISILAGPYSFLFYVQVLLLGVLPLILLAQKKEAERISGDGIAAGLVLLGVLVDKYLVLVPKQMNPAIAFPSTPFNAGPAYATTIAEWSLTIGLLALVGLLYHIASRAMAREVPAAQAPIKEWRVA